MARLLRRTTPPLVVLIGLAVVATCDRTGEDAKPGNTTHPKGPGPSAATARRDAGLSIDGTKRLALIDACNRYGAAHSGALPAVIIVTSAQPADVERWFHSSMTPSTVAPMEDVIDGVPKPTGSGRVLVAWWD